MPKEYGDQRGTRRYNVRDFQLYWTPSGLLSFLSAGKQAKNKLPVVNFSVGGAQFLSAKDLPRGERVRIHLSGPILPDAMAVEAEVCWSRQIPRRSAYRVGVRFTTKASRQEKFQELEARLGDMTIRLRCAGCGTPFSVKKSFEGEAGRCPRCKAVVEVREEELLPELPEEKKTVEEKPGAAAPGPVASGGLSKAMTLFIRSTIPSRLHLELIQHFTKRPSGQVFGVSELAMLVSVPEPRVHATLKEMTARGVLKELGAKTFNYDPSPDAKRKIAELASLLGNPLRRSEVLAAVLACEKGK